MTWVLALPVWLASAASAQDTITPRFAWPDGARWRIVDQWELDASDADGDKELRSGVGRALWTWEPTADGKTLTLRQPVIVRATPREDPVARAIGAALAEPWHAVLGWDDTARASSPAPAEASSSAPPAPVAPVTSAPPAEGEAAPPAEIAPSAATPEDGTAQAAPSDAATPGPIAPTEPPAAKAAFDLVAFVRGDPVAQFERVFHAIDGIAFVPGRPVFDVPGLQVPGAESSVRVDPLAWCPDVGPGSHCIQLTFTTLVGGAPAEGTLIPSGGRRDEAVWVVDRDTMVPHRARTDAFAAYDGPGGTVRQAHASHVLSFLPPEPPAAVVP